MALAMQKLAASLTALACSARAEAPGLRADRVQQRLHVVDGLRRAGGEQVELACRSHIGPAEHRHGQVIDAALGVQGRQFARQRDRHRGQVDVHRTGRQRVEHAAFEQYLAHGLVVGQHREQHRPRRFGRRRGGRSAGGGQRLYRCGAAVPDDDGVAGGEQVAGDGLAHVAQAEESDVHGDNSFHR